MAAKKFQLEQNLTRTRICDHDPLQQEVDDVYALPPFPPKFETTPLSQVRFKEVLLIFLALLLMVCSILLFYKHWKKNYRDINQLPYYAYLYQKEIPEFPTPVVGGSVVTPGHPNAIDLWKSSGQAISNLHAFRNMQRSMQNISPNSADSADDLRRLAHSHSGNFRLGTPRIPPPASRVLARTGTAPTFFPNNAPTKIGRMPVTPPVNIQTAKPNKISKPIIARSSFAPPKRASSEVYPRFHRCQIEVMRRIQSGLELPEESEPKNDVCNGEEEEEGGCGENEEVCMVSITSRNNKASPFSALEMDREKRQSCNSSIATDV